MAEVQFAKAFLATLDRKPAKLSSDFVSDPKKYPSQSPYILPKPAHPFPPPNSVSGPTRSTLTVTLKPTKPAPSTPNLTLKDQDATQVTVLDLKQHYATSTSLDVSKIKILHNKRPAADLKTLRDLLPTPLPADVELGVMILGGATPAAQAGSATAAAVAEAGPGSEAAAAESGAGAEGPTESGIEVGRVLGSDEFWADLKGFLVQRLRDEGEGARLAGVFRRAAGR